MSTEAPRPLVEPTLENFRKDVDGLAAFASLVADNYEQRDPATAAVIRAFSKPLSSYVADHALK